MKIVRPNIINDAALVSSNVAETDYPAYSAGTTYALGAIVLYIVADKHWVIQSLQNSNTGHTPTGLTSDTWWLLIGNDNRWRMFDQSVQSQTSNPSTIDVVLTGANRVDSVILLNLSAASARVKMTDATDGLVYDQTYSLISNSGVNDWYAYFFEPIARLTDKAITNLPPYSGAMIEVILSDGANTVLCGGCILGLSKDFGAAQYGLTTGITDYSVKQQDVFGNYTVLQRGFRKRADITFNVANTLIEQLQNLLAAYRATPSVYIGADDYANTIIYGFYKDFNININYVNYSICTLSLEGLT